MGELSQKIISDPSLLSKLRKYGKFDAQGCFNCGSCTVICNLANGSSSFPRRTIQYGLWGLKPLVIGSLEPWLCYYCGNCSTTCPRQAEPGEAMMTLRRYLTAQYDWTGLASKFFQSKTWQIAAFFLVGALFLFLTRFYPNLSEIMEFGHSLEKFLILIVALFIILPSAFRMYWFTILKSSKVKIPLNLYFTEIKTLILHMVTQKKFLECTANQMRWLKHWLVVSGYILLLTLVVFLDWFKTATTLPIYHPLRWLGYYATGVLIIFTGEIIIGRIRKKEQLHKFSELADWLFPIWLLMMAASALVVHILLSIGFSQLTTYYLYVFHLIVLSQWAIIIVPFGKWIHFIHRPLAIYLQSIKEKAVQQQVFKEMKKEVKTPA